MLIKHTKVGTEGMAEAPFYYFFEFIMSNICSESEYVAHINRYGGWGDTEPSPPSKPTMSDMKRIADMGGGRPRPARGKCVN